jgi:hypothetical protein
MAKFLNNKELNKAVVTLFEEAETHLMIVSPFIKLHPKLKSILDKKKGDPNFFIELLYGKNVEKVEKSMSIDDLDYFKGFRNVKIRYSEHLHAKYYANENASIVTSLNLYEYSMNNNIESGVLFESGWLSRDRKNDDEAFDYFSEIIEKSEVVYSKDVKEEKVFFGLFTKDGGSAVLEDNTKDYYKTAKPKTKSKPISKPKGNLLSATALGKLKGKSFNVVVSCMENKGFIKNNDITPSGKKEGLQFKSNAKGDSWIVYPESLKKTL